MDGAWISRPLGLEQAGVPRPAHEDIATAGVRGDEYPGYEGMTIRAVMANIWDTCCGDPRHNKFFYTHDFVFNITNIMGYRHHIARDV